jgi:succinate dehydrogenase/fumarate reductase-like Fe-S protein
MTQPQTVLHIRRGTGATDARFEDFTIAYEDGASVLDALMKIRREQDSSLAFRYACISANVCKECVMLIDGEKAYACTSRLREGRMTLEPLVGKTLLRDLATDLVPPREKL